MVTTRSSNSPISNPNYRKSGSTKSNNSAIMRRTPSSDKVDKTSISNTKSTDESESSMVNGSAQAKGSPSKDKLSSSLSRKSTTTTPSYPLADPAKIGVAILTAISIFTLPDSFTPSVITFKHVWYYGWITALSTGLGVVPLVFAPEMVSFSKKIMCYVGRFSKGTLFLN